MAILRLEFRSKILMGMTRVSMIMPYDKLRAPAPSGNAFEYGIPEHGFKTLWLLHGGGGGSDYGITNSLISDWAANNGFAVVMPDLNTSQYADMLGFPAWTYMNEELQPLVRAVLPLSPRREDNFVTGYSMGGVGAMKWALNCPEKFTAAGVMSCGPVDVVERVAAGDPVMVLNVQRMYGNEPEKVRGSCDDLWFKAREAVEKGVSLPKILISSGDADAVAFAQFDRFRRYAEEIGFPAEFEVRPGETHSADSFNASLRRTLSWMGLMK